MKIKTRFFLLFCLVVIVLSTSHFTQAKTEKLTGNDWLKISDQRKQYYVFGQIEYFQGKGVVFTRTPADYVELLDQKVAIHKELRSDDMDRIFTVVVDEAEAKSSKTPL